MSEYNYSYEQQPPVPNPEKERNARSKGIISLILGIASLTGLFPFLIGIAMAIVGLVLSSQARRDGETQFSKAGKVTSIIGLVLRCLVSLLVILLLISGLLTGIISGGLLSL